jgi:curli biogenesis system outer membrane secretion channel CsgG
MVTEYSETADASGKAWGGGLGGMGLATGVIGAITENRDAAAVGMDVAIANASARRGDMKRKGMVGMDLQLVDGRTARIVRSYNCSGTFTTISSVSGLSVFGIGGTNTEFAASALSQATRAAMNDALQKIADARRTVR